MTFAIRTGDTVRCIDNGSREDWARWYADDAYAEDMLAKGRLYLVRALAVYEDQAGLDIGIPTPWGDQFWNADRFEKSLLHLPSKPRAASVDTRPEGGDAPKIAAPSETSGAVGEAETPKGGSHAPNH